LQAYSEKVFSFKIKLLVVSFIERDIQQNWFRSAVGLHPIKGSKHSYTGKGEFAPNAKRREVT